jgi:hypothetical protein
LGLPLLLVVTRFVWPLHLPLSVKCVAALLLLVASQYHFWSRLSSGSMFAPEFPRPIVSCRLRPCPRLRAFPSGVAEAKDMPKADTLEVARLLREWVRNEITRMRSQLRA